MIAEQTSEISQPTQPVPSVPVEPKRKFHFSLIAVLLIAISLIAVGVYAGIKIGKKQTTGGIPKDGILPKETPQVFVETITLKPTEIPDETANWKTYKNEKYSFAFSYPSEYFKYILETDNSVYLAPSEGIGEARGSPMGLDLDDIWMNVSVFDMDPGKELSLDGFINLKEQKSFYDAVSKKENILIGGERGYKMIWDIPQGPNAIYFIKGLVKKENNVYGVDLSSFRKEPLLAKEDMFDQILSTFKFTN